MKSTLENNYENSRFCKILLIGTLVVDVVILRPLEFLIFVQRSNKRFEIVSFEVRVGIYQLVFEYFPGD